MGGGLTTPFPARRAALFPRASDVRREPRRAEKRQIPRRVSLGLLPFPQLPRKHRDPALFRAADFHRYVARRSKTPRPALPQDMVLVFGRRRWVRHLRYRFGAPLDAALGVYRATGSVGVTTINGPGAPFAVIVLEELAALGVRRVVLVGMAGSLRTALRAGSFVVCDRALRDEGTSHHYVGPGRYAYPSTRLTSALRAALERRGEPFASGPSWTTDAVYRETAAEVRRYRRRGILTVEMEASAVFTVAALLGVEAAALFVVSDHLDEGGWEPRFHDIRAPLRRGLRVGVDALSGTSLRARDERLPNPR